MYIIFYSTTVAINVLCYSDPTVKLHKFHTLITELLSFVSPTNTPVHKSLDFINAHLYDTVIACRAALTTELQTEAESFVIKEKVQPGQKMEHQWRFRSNNKRPGQKSSGLV